MDAPRTADEASVRLLVLVGVLAGVATGIGLTILWLDDIDRALVSLGYA